MVLAQEGDLALPEAEGEASFDATVASTVLDATQSHAPPTIGRCLPSVSPLPTNAPRKISRIDSHIEEAFTTENVGNDSIDETSDATPTSSSNLFESDEEEEKTSQPSQLIDLGREIKNEKKIESRLRMCSTFVPEMNDSHMLASLSQGSKFVVRIA